MCVLYYICMYIQRDGVSQPRVACPSECVKSNDRSGGYLKFVQLSTSQNKELYEVNGVWRGLEGRMDWRSEKQLAYMYPNCEFV